MCYVYILKNRQGKYYIGSCKNIDIRLKRHNQNSVRSTKNKGPFRIIYKEEFSTLTEALKRENQLKAYKGGRAFQKLIETSWSPSSSLV